mmetsp:Transcript_4052/g.8200  ORF Transcript_4052/g.8200 Transcript_4052/m.8200 type:complete len:300 (+) Transcript_4052:611-1510(+)
MAVGLHRPRRRLVPRGVRHARLRRLRRRAHDGRNRRHLRRQDPRTPHGTLRQRRGPAFAAPQRFADHLGHAHSVVRMVRVQLRLHPRLGRNQRLQGRRHHHPVARRRRPHRHGSRPLGVRLVGLVQHAQLRVGRTGLHHRGMLHHPRRTRSRRGRHRSRRLHALVQADAAVEDRRPLGRRIRARNRRNLGLPRGRHLRLPRRDRHGLRMRRRRHGRSVCDSARGRHRHHRLGRLLVDHHLCDLVQGRMVARPRRGRGGRTRHLRARRQSVRLGLYRQGEGRRRRRLSLSDLGKQLRFNE